MSAEVAAATARTMLLLDTVRNADKDDDDVIASCPVHVNVLQALLHLQTQACNGYLQQHNFRRTGVGLPVNATAAAAAASSRCTCALHTILIKVHE